jgi:RNA recognition motif-containing protein
LNSPSAISESESDGRKGTPQDGDADYSLTGDSILLTVNSDSPPIQTTKRKKQRRASLDSPSDTDESTSSKFARSRASSEDSLNISEDETITVPRNRLFVGGIPLQLREHEIVELFSKFGKVKHVIVLKTKYGTSKVLLNS